MKRDMANQFEVKRLLSPASVSDNTAQVSQIIDTRDYDGVLILLNVGSIADADATFAVLLEHGDVSNLSDAAAVEDADMTSQTAGTAPETAAAFQFDDDNEVRKIGYIGNKRYIRLTITPSANASAALLSAICLLGYAHRAPITQGAT